MLVVTLPRGFVTAISQPYFVTHIHYTLPVTQSTVLQLLKHRRRSHMLTYHVRLPIKGHLEPAHGSS